MGKSSIFQNEVRMVKFKSTKNTWAYIDTVRSPVTFGFLAISSETHCSSCCCFYLCWPPINWWPHS